MRLFKRFQGKPRESSQTQQADEDSLGIVGNGRRFKLRKSKSPAPVSASAEAPRRATILDGQNTEQLVVSPRGRSPGPGKDQPKAVASRTRSSTPTPIPIAAKPPSPLPFQTSPRTAGNGQSVSGTHPRSPRFISLTSPPVAEKDGQVLPRKPEVPSQSSILGASSPKKQVLPPLISRDEEETDESTEEDDEDDAEESRVAPPAAPSIPRIFATPRTSRVGFAATIVTGVSRPLNHREIDKLTEFETHARKCEKCRSPCEQATSNYGFCSLCDSGYDLALRVLRLGLRCGGAKDANEVVKRSRDMQDEQRVELSPREYENSHSLLKALQQFGKMQFLRPEGTLDAYARGRSGGPMSYAALLEESDGHSTRRKRRRSARRDRPPRSSVVMMERERSFSPRHSDASFGRRSSLYTLDHYGDLDRSNRKPDLDRTYRKHYHTRRRNTPLTSTDEIYDIYEPSFSENMRRRRRRPSYHMESDDLHPTYRDRDRTRRGPLYESPSHDDYYAPYGDSGSTKMYYAERPRRPRRNFDGLISGLSDLGIASRLDAKLKMGKTVIEEVPARRELAVAAN